MRETKKKKNKKDESVRKDNDRANDSHNSDPTHQRLTGQEAKAPQTSAFYFNMIKIIFTYLKYVCWIHEIFHWIPARLLKVPIQMLSDRVYFDLDEENWKNTLIVSGPLIIGIAAFVTLLFFVSRGLDRGWLCPAIMFIASCILDICDLVYFAKTGKWKEESDK